MATAAPHVKLLRQLANAKDDYLSGALDITWEEGRATIFLVFGQPSHAEFESPGRVLEGHDAVSAMQDELPRSFEVGPWRRAMSPKETLHLSLAELTEPFVAQAGAQTGALEPEAEGGAAWWSADDDSPVLGFGLSDFPLLPAGAKLWDEAPAAALRLEERLASLPAALVVLSGLRLRAAGVVSGGELIDAVWVDTEDHARGETAAMALVGAAEGTLSGYRLDPPELAELLPGLWRQPVAASGIALSWLDADAMITALKADGASRTLLIDAPDRGVALFAGGRLVAVYSAEKRTPSPSEYALKALLAQDQGTLSVLQAKAAQAIAPAPAPPVPTAATPPLHAEAAPARPQTQAANGTPAGPQVAPGWYSELAGPEPALEAAPPPPPRPEPAPPAPPVAAPPAALSDFVDFDEVRGELIAIGVEWLGDPGALPVTEMIRRTAPTIDAFVAVIDTIRGLKLAGFDPAAIQSMARQMHHHAAERLCGA